MKKKLENLFGSILLIVLITACVNDGSETKSAGGKDSVESVSPIDINSHISTDTSKLSRLLDFTTYRPDSVTFSLEGLNVDSSAIDTTKNFGLEAVLFYEEHVYGSILEKYMDAGFPKGDYKKDDFEFNWLDAKLKAELNLSKDDYKGNPDIFLGSGGQARLWFSDEKVFLKWLKQ